MEREKEDFIMSETAFLEAAEALFTRVEDAVEEAGLDIDSSRNGNVLTLESDGGEQVVINMHAPTEQVWLASRAGGLHFTLEDGRWTGTRDGGDFWLALEKALGFILGERVKLS
jgi:CyaY protein